MTDAASGEEVERATNCPECNAKVENSAVRCSNCGFPLDEKSSKSKPGDRLHEAASKYLPALRRLLVDRNTISAFVARVRKGIKSVLRPVLISFAVIAALIVAVFIARAALDYKEQYDREQKRRATIRKALSTTASPDAALHLHQMLSLDEFEEEYANASQKDKSAWRQFISENLAGIHQRTESTEDFCKMLQAFRGHKLTKGNEPTLKACGDLSAARQKLAAKQNEYKTALEKHERNQAKRDRALEALERAEEELEEEKKNYAVFTGYIWQQTKHNQYEVSPVSLFGDIVRSKRFVLRTTSTNFETKGRFRLPVMYLWDEEVRLKNGFTTKWPVIVEVESVERALADEKAAVEAARDRLNSIEYISVPLKPDLTAEEAAIENAKERVVATLGGKRRSSPG